MDNFFLIFLMLGIIILYKDSVISMIIIEWDCKKVK